MGKNIKILLIDDEIDFLQPVALWLETNGYAVVTAPDGDKGLEIIKRDRPDIVFLDLMMPMMDGIETLRILRSFDKELPVVIITVEYTNEKKFREASELGISGFFAKKGSFEELERTIQVALKTHKGLK